MPTKRPRNESFEEHVTAVLEAQDRALEANTRSLERMESKLEAPALNGGFDKVIERLAKIDNVTEKLRECQEATSKKVEDIHTVVMDPDTGLYHTVKTHTKWIDVVSKGLKWFGGLVIVGMLSGLGKLAYDFISGHIHFTP